VGDSTVRKSNIRIVAATNRDALEAVRQGKIREDLYYRLHVIPVALPPLRDRGADILLLAESFLARYSSEEGKSFEGFTRDAEEWMISHNWPGNVRELENLIRQVVVLNTGGSIARAQLPSVDAVQTIEPRREDALILTAADTVPEPEYGLEPLWMTEKKAIERAIALCRGNVVAAAKQLQINPSTIYRKKASWAES
jgi:two-component system repressor protein LuxO